jgi:hypothetical protein
MVLLDLIRAHPSSEVVLGISSINLRPSAEGAMRLLILLRIGNHLIALRHRLKNELGTRHQSANDLSRETCHGANHRKVHKLSREISQKWSISKVTFRKVNLIGKSF